LSGDHVLGGVQILVVVHYERDFYGEGPKGSIHDTPSIIYFEGQSIAGAQFRIIRGSTWDALIADERTPKGPRQFILLRCGLRRKGTNCQHSPDGKVFQRHFSSCF
jgi:hypothetical protein